MTDRPWSNAPGKPLQIPLYILHHMRLIKMGLCWIAVWKSRWVAAETLTPPLPHPPKKRKKKISDLQILSSYFYRALYTSWMIVLWPWLWCSCCELFLHSSENKMVRPVKRHSILSGGGFPGAAKKKKKKKEIAPVSWVSLDSWQHEDKHQWLLHPKTEFSKNLSKENNHSL